MVNKMKWGEMPREDSDAEDDADIQSGTTPNTKR
eukprot:CAMPEP_0116881772 /NCGR_PEP_ID=MMETSP0463-20121206/13828_1 /TAXON_ID=181622 /ORGANISM="Strombidinopsis sp, Strain SopsisLIS2011" /LENGTH=33 /DNA_ID= /DNA_START= /DNA_END= /DNA_ORIENTATION=